MRLSIETFLDEWGPTDELREAEHDPQVAETKGTPTTLTTLGELQPDLVGDQPRLAVANVGAAPNSKLSRLDVDE